MTLELREVPAEEDLPAHVAQIRRWYRACWLLYLLFLPGVAILAPLAHAIVGAEWAVAIPAVAWMVAIIVVQSRANSFLCPRCGEPVRPFNSFQLPWDVRCPRCDLPISRGSER